MCTAPRSRRAQPPSTPPPTAIQNRRRTTGPNVRSRTDVRGDRTDAITTQHRPRKPSRQTSRQTSRSSPRQRSRNASADVAHCVRKPTPKLPVGTTSQELQNRARKSATKPELANCCKKGRFANCCISLWRYTKKNAVWYGSGTGNWLTAARPPTSAHLWAAEPIPGRPQVRTCGRPNVYRGFRHFREIGTVGAKNHGNLLIALGKEISGPAPSISKIA